MTSKHLYIGIMSGTSADGIDLALVDYTTTKPILIATSFQPYNEETYKQVTSLYEPSNNEIDRAFSLHVTLAKQYASAVNQFLADQHLHSSQIIAIGNHGQTIRHRPTINAAINAPFTLQIGCNQTLATLTDIPVIGDFRTKDMALGGQGAPLVPAFHQALFPRDKEDIFVVNIGGIANITYLPSQHDKSVLGFDTGPGNALMDEWYRIHQDGRFDKNGNWASSGTISNSLLNHFLSDPYFKMSAPKSTGREYFNVTWLNEKLTNYSSNQPLNTNDIQATLTALTAHTIAEQVNKISTKSNVYFCGGGSLNKHLFSLLKQELNKHNLNVSDDINVNSDALEAMAFSWLAYAFNKKIPGNIPAVTGATKETVLGVQFLP